MITPSAPLGGHLQLGRDRERLVLDVDDAVLRQPAHAAEQQLCVALDQGGPPGDVGYEAFDLPVIERKHVVLDRLDQPKPLQFMQFLRILLRQVLGLRPVGVAVVELPDVVVEGRQHRAAHLPRRAVLGHRAPALVVNASVAEHLEVLGLVPLGRLGVVEAVQHAGALVRALHHAVDDRRLRNARRLQHRWRDVDDMGELVAHAALVLDALRARTRWCRCGCRPSARRPAWSTDTGASIAHAQPTA